MIDWKTIKVGDRVVRDTAVGIRRGVIARRYASVPNGRGETLPLFAVTWDDSKTTEDGYLANNLTLEPVPSGMARTL
jgi:hypothetical protein